MTAPAPPETAGSTLTPLSGDEGKLFAELKAELGPRIQVVSLLGRGGMALVFLGRDPQLKRSIAIKVMSPSFAGAELARTRFTREAQAAAMMTHPNIAGVYDVGELPSAGGLGGTGGTPYFLMQFVDGSSLARSIETAGMWSEARVRRMIGEVASALAAAHARGLVHRDVKPANIIIESESKRAVVVDFGITAALDKNLFSDERDEGGTLTAIGTYVGTPRYTSPEQAASDSVSGKSDVYSLGVVAFEVLTGRAPFQDTTPMALLAAHIKDTPPAIRTLRPDVDANFAALVDRCLLKDPAARPDAAEIASFLVPEPQAAIEWPPPGLEELRGQAARVARSFNWVGAFAAIFVLALAIQPSRGTSAWYHFEQSLAWSMIANMGIGSTDIAGTPDATPAWLFVLFLAYAGAMLAFIVLIVRAAGLYRSVRHGRAQGYPIEVLTAVAADDDEDTAPLLNRSGRFAMLTQDQQRLLLRARRTRLVALPAGVILSFLAMLAWLLVSRTAAARELLPLTQALLLLSPAIIGALVTLDSRVKEVRLLGQSLWAQAPRVPSRAEFIRDWLERVKGRAQVRVTPRSLVAGGVGVVLGGAMLFGFFVVAVAAILSSRVVTATRGESGVFSLGDGWYSGEARLHQLVDSLVPRRDRTRADIKSDTTADMKAVRLFAAGAYANIGMQRVLPAEMREFPPLDRGAGIFNDLIFQGRWPRAIPQARLAELSASPWVAILSRFGRGTDAPAPFLYPTRELLRERATSRFGIASLGAPGLNASIARFVVLLDGKREREAREVAEDVTRAGMRLMTSPLQEEYARGVLLAFTGLVMLREYAKATGDVGLTRLTSAAVAQATATHRRRHGPRQRQQGLIWASMGDLSDSTRVMHMMTDWRLHPYEQWSAMRALVTSYCTNAREILFGISPKRLDYLSFAVAEVTVPRTDEWAHWQSARLEELMSMRLLARMKLCASMSFVE